MPYRAFFMIEVPSLLKKLDSDAQALWGSMSVDEALDHLRKGIDLSLQNTSIEILIPEEKIPSYKKFLMSDRPFMQSAPMPKEYNLIRSFPGDFESLKLNLMKSVVNMLVHFEKNPDHTAIHPNFGILNTTEWLQLHRKHFIHHFTQFGLIAP